MRTISQQEANIQIHVECILQEIANLREEDPILPNRDDGPDMDEVDAIARNAAQRILKESKVYNAGGCPLCLG